MTGKAFIGSKSIEWSEHPPGCSALVLLLVIIILTVISSVSIASPCDMVHLPIYHHTVTVRECGNNMGLDTHSIMIEQINITHINKSD